MSKKSEFDFVVVGSGSAGCVLANRLTADKTASVLLLEAGRWNYNPWIKIPIGWFRIVQKRWLDWQYETEPEPHLLKRTIICPRGKLVGGSSSINAMGYVRGNRCDFDRWAENGLPEWSYDQVLPYFKKQESWAGGAGVYRGGNGPLLTEFTKFEDPLVDAFEHAVHEAGYPRIEDFNGADQEGFGKAQHTLRNGRRWMGAEAYLKPVLGRGNLRLSTRAMATKIIFEGNRAVGIEYEQNGKIQRVFAKREVILASGVFNSPKLLMLSGVGDPLDLHKHGIEVKIDLPGVGKNLQDHPTTLVTFVRDKPGPLHRTMRVDRITWALFNAYFFGRGIAATLPTGVMGFLKSESKTTHPDVQFIMVATSLNPIPYLWPFKSPYQDTYSNRVIALRPQSRGYVALKSSNPGAPPRIVFNLLQEENDVRVLRNGIKAVRNIASRPSLRGFTQKEISPGAPAQSDHDIDQYIRKTAITLYHPAGTCKMGKTGDQMAVVDSQLRVVGAESLRVVDASVMPDLVSGNINAAVVMIAERAADFILGSR